MLDGNKVVIVDVGELSKPGTKLINKISNAISGFAKPWQMRRIADAEAYAQETIARSDATVAAIQSQTEIEVTDLRRRAIQRWVSEEEAQQLNMEEILAAAIPLLSDESRPDEIEDDWIVNTFDKCRLISDDEMQLLWARVLAGEADRPGTVSKRTVSILSSLDKRDAQLFRELCSFVWEHDGDPEPLIYETDDDVYAPFDTSFSTLEHLDDVGLINHATGNRQYGLVTLPESITMQYFGDVVRVSGYADGNLIVGKAFFTRAGKQLFRVCEPKPNAAFLDFVIKRWDSMGYRMSSPTGATPDGG